MLLSDIGEGNPVHQNFTHGEKLQHRICYVLNAFAVGGAETVALDLARSLDRGRFAVTVLATHDPSPDGDTLMRARFREHQVETVAWNLGAMRNPLAIYKLWRFFRVRRFDVVHGHNRPSDGWAVVAARRAGVSRLFWTRHLVYQDLTPRQIRRYSSLSKHVSAVLAVSDTVREHCIGVERIAPEKVVTVPNGIDVARYAPLAGAARARVRQDLGVGPEELLLLFVGRFDEQKAPEAFPRLVWELRSRGWPVRGFMCGGGGLRDSLDSQVSNGPFGVTILGYRNDVPELLGACDLFVSVSRNEGLPLNVMEAMAAGAPFVAPRIAQISCLLDTDCGLAASLMSPPPAGGPVSEAQINEWAEHVTNFLADGKERVVRGLRGRKIIEHQYSLNSMVRKHVDLYGIG